MDFKPSNIRMWSRLGPSGAISAVATEFGKENPEVVFLTADMTSASGLERFKKSYPDRLYNVGIAEQNTVGIATGLAEMGFVPYAATYASFFATRALDQVKMCMGYMKSNVKLLGLYAGTSTGIMGPTHMSIEDISAIRAIPNITIESPADTTEIVKTLIHIKDYDGPVYVRLTGDMNSSVVYDEDFEFQIGKANKLSEGKDIVIFATGSMVDAAVKTANLLSEMEIESAVYDIHTIKPFDTDCLKEAIDYKLIVTMEEHSIIGGLGSTVLEGLSESNYKGKILRFGFSDSYPHAASYRYILDQQGLSPEAMSHKISEYNKGIC